MDESGQSGDAAAEDAGAARSRGGRAGSDGGPAASDEPWSNAGAALEPGGSPAGWRASGGSQPGFTDGPVRFGDLFPQLSPPMNGRDPRGSTASRLNGSAPVNGRPVTADSAEPAGRDAGYSGDYDGAGRFDSPLASRVPASAPPYPYEGDLEDTTRADRQPTADQPDRSRRSDRQGPERPPAERLVSERLLSDRPEVPRPAPEVDRPGGAPQPPRPAGDRAPGPDTWRAGPRSAEPARHALNEPTPPEGLPATPTPAAWGDPSPWAQPAGPPERPAAPNQPISPPGRYGTAPIEPPPGYEPTPLRVPPFEPPVERYPTPPRRPEADPGRADPRFAAPDDAAGPPDPRFPAAEPGRSEPARSEPGRHEPFRLDTSRLDTARLDPSRLDTARLEAGRPAPAEPHRPEAGRPAAPAELSRRDAEPPEPPRPEPVRYTPYAAEPGRYGPSPFSAAEPDLPDPHSARPEPSREPARPEPVRPRPSSGFTGYGATGRSVPTGAEPSGYATADSYPGRSEPRGADPLRAGPPPADPPGADPLAADPLAADPRSRRGGYAGRGLHALPRRVPAEPDVPVVPAPPSVDPPAEAPQLARIATHLRRGDAPPRQRPDGFDVTAILAAVREVDGVRDATLRTTPAGAHSLRLDLAEGADPAEVSRKVARLLQDRMGLAAAPQNLAGLGLPAVFPPAPVPYLPTQAQPGGRPAPTPGAAALPRPTDLSAGRPVEPADAGAAAPGSPRPGGAPTGAAGEPGPSTSVPEQASRRTGAAARGRASVEHRPGERPAADAAPASPADEGPDARADLGGQLTYQGPGSDPIAPRPLVPGHPPGPRVVIDHVVVNTYGIDATVEVRLAVGDQSAVGVARGPAVEAYVLRLCATATATAVDELLTMADHPDGPVRCFVEHAAAVPLGSCEVAVVVLLLVCGGWVEQLSGSAVVAGDHRHAAVRATLAAVNRRLEALLS